MSTTITSSQMQFKNYKTFRYTLAGRPLVLETGKVAGLANGSVMVHYGDTCVLCCDRIRQAPRRYRFPAPLCRFRGENVRSR